MFLREIAYARSGDKGNHANIALIAFDEKGYALIKEQVTGEAVQRYFGALHPQKVERFEVPNLLAFNFVLHDALGGGASESLRYDSQGKALGQALLQMRIEP